MVFKKSFTLLVATGTTQIFLVVPIISENQCNLQAYLTKVEGLASEKMMFDEKIQWKYQIKSITTRKVYFKLVKAIASFLTPHTKRIGHAVATFIIAPWLGLIYNWTDKDMSLLTFKALNN